MTGEESYIPYLVMVRFDKDDGEIKARIAESAPVLRDVLGQIGSVQAVEMSYDGSMMAFLVAASPKFENTLQVHTFLQKSSAMITHDKILVVAISMGSASRLERVTSWLREC